MPNPYIIQTLLEYPGDFSGDFNSHTLVTKEYVDDSFIGKRKTLTITIGVDAVDYALSDPDTDYTYFLNDNCTLILPDITSFTKSSYRIISIADIPPTIQSWDHHPIKGLSPIPDDHVIMLFKYSSFSLIVDDTQSFWIFL